MGDSDRMKNYISDYLENSLDPSTHKEFEDALKLLSISFKNLNFDYSGSIENDIE